MAKPHYIYILTSKRNGTLYTGITSNLARRVYEHREKLIKGFTKQYNVSRLVYIEPFDTRIEAIEREKQVKRWKRVWKIELIEKDNPTWRDLYDDIQA